MNCFPLNDTLYDASALGAWCSTRTRGVYSAENNLAVSANGGMTVKVSKGLAWLQMSEFWGVNALLEHDIVLNIDASDGVLHRYDPIVIRLDKIANEAPDPFVQKGAPSSSPALSPPVRDESYDEIFIGYVSVPAGTVEITPDLIHDLRMDEQYCGLMRDGVTSIPTEQLTAQARALIQRLEDELQGVEAGSEFLLKSVYDSNNNGVVDDSEKLGGIHSNVYMLKTQYDADGDGFIDYAVKTNKEVQTLYVNGTTGSDSGDGTAERPFATIAYALSKLPATLSHDVTVICTGYVGPLIAQNFCPPGQLIITSDSGGSFFDVGANQVRFLNNYTRITVVNCSTSYVASNAGSYNVERCPGLIMIDNCRLTGASVSASRGISVQEATVYVPNFNFAGSRVNGYFALRQGEIFVNGNAGTAPTTLAAAYGGTIKVAATTLSLTRAVTQAGEIIGPSGSSVG